MHSCSMQGPTGLFLYRQYHGVRGCSILPTEKGLTQRATPSPSFVSVLLGIASSAEGRLCSALKEPDADLGCCSVSE